MSERVSPDSVVLASRLSLSGTEPGERERG